MALTFAVTAALSGAAVADTAPAAAGPSEIAVVPPDDPTTHAVDQVLVAGTSGFLHERQGVDGLVWTDYATGTSAAFPALAGVPASSVLPAGGDAFAWQDTAAGTLHVATAASGIVGTYTLPGGVTLRGLADGGKRALGTRLPTSSGPGQVELMSLTAPGTLVQLPVTGLPDGAIPAITRVLTDGATHALVPYRLPDSTAYRYSLLDLVTGAATDVPGMPAVLPRILLTPGDIAWTAVGNGHTVVSMLPQQAVEDGSAATTAPATVTLPDSTYYALAPSGDHLLAVHAPAGQTGRVGEPDEPFVDYPFGGAAPTTVLASDAAFPVAAPDGSVVVAGGAGATVAAVHRYTHTPNAAGLADATVLPLPPVQARNAGLTLAHGFLRHVQGTPVFGGGTQLALGNHELAPGTGFGDIPYGGLLGGNLPATTLPCQAGTACVHTVDGNFYGTSFLMADAMGNTQIRSVEDIATSVMSYTLPFTGGRLLDVSAEYELVQGGSPARDYVIEPGQRKIVTSGPATGAALWNSTLWQAPTTSPAGTVTASDLTAYPSPKVVRTLTTGTACRPAELQTSQHWLYWTCGATGPAGVIDLTTGHRIPVPAGQALLGDGFVVLHDSSAGRLLLVDVHTGTAAAAVALADLPASALADDRGITWAVDRFSGGVAYVAADRSVHVLTTGVPASAPAGLTGQSPWLTPGDPNYSSWSMHAYLSRPVDAWRVVISNARGTTVHASSGGSVRTVLETSWDGKLADGSLAPSGSYHWQGTVSVHGTWLPVAGLSGTFLDECGAPVFRSYDCDGRQALLGVAPDGRGRWYTATSTGQLASIGWTEDWPLGSGSSSLTSALVPFGDIDGDRRNDLLARDGTGVLTAYLGYGDPDFARDNPDLRHVRIGGGWNIYNAFAAPGDLTGDGRTDLVARDGSGVLWLYAATGRSSFATRVRIGGGWQAYTRIVGAGDLDGDGIGDLLAVDRSGGFWRYYGNGQGGFTSRAAAGTNWGVYNAVIGVGDLSQDGRADLVARDRSGVLWRYDGNGHGGFGNRVRIGGGWQEYAALF